MTPKIDAAGRNARATLLAGRGSAPAERKVSLMDPAGKPVGRLKACPTKSHRGTLVEGENPGACRWIWGVQKISCKCFDYNRCTVRRGAEAGDVR